MAEEYVLLVRHGETAGNRERRYVGSTDEELTAEAVQKLERVRREQLSELFGKYLGNRESMSGARGTKNASERVRQNGAEPVKGGLMDEIHLYMSPMRRCRRTAAILFPGVKGTVIDDFREMNFGRFEYKNYNELNGDPAYQAYIDSGGESAFPGGESKREFCHRVVREAEPLIFPKKEHAEGPLAKGLRHKTAGGIADDGAELTVIVAHGGTIMAIMDRFSSPHEDYFSWQLPPGGMLLLKRNERSLEVVER